ncbi:MAG TPA: VOC family protein [Friedmanniella sp.]
MPDDHRASAGAARTAYKDLCVDVTDLDAAALFLGPLLGLQTVERRDPVLRLGDGVDAHAVWLNLVPDERTVKNRVHLDVHVASVEDVVALGARVTDERFPWTVLSHDQAGELCAFVRPPERLPAYRLYKLVVDCADHERVAAWWADRFGVPVQSDGEIAWLEGGDGPPWEIVFNTVPEPKTVKNRVHWDVVGSTPELLDAGATLLRARDEEIGWDVLADVEGNEFCVFAAE